MKEAGILLIVLGVVAGAGAFLITTSSHVGYTPSLSPYASAMPTDVVNLWGLHVQALIFQGGFAAVIAGSVLYGFGSVDETLKRNAGTLPKAAPSSPPVLPVVPAYVPPEVGEEKPDHSMIWIAVAGLGITAIIVLALLAAQKQTPGTANASYDANGDMSMDTNVVMDNFLTPPPRRSPGRR